jgi:hypothetical protein
MPMVQLNIQCSPVVDECVNIRCRHPAYFLSNWSSERHDAVHLATHQSTNKNTKEEEKIIKEE